MRISALKPKFTPDRSTLMDEISSPDATVAAEGLLEWADSMKPREVRVRYSKGGVAAIRAPRGKCRRTYRSTATFLHVPIGIVAGLAWCACAVPSGAGSPLH